jgi:hypothetical protein
MTYQGSHIRHYTLILRFISTYSLASALHVAAVRKQKYIRVPSVFGAFLAFSCRVVFLQNAEAYRDREPQNKNQEHDATRADGITTARNAWSE